MLNDDCNLLRQEAVADPYKDEPERHPALKVLTAKPFNAETPAAVIDANMVTPSELFYVRNHLPVPKVDPEKYVLRIEGEGMRTVDLSLKVRAAKLNSCGSSNQALLGN